MRIWGNLVGYQAVWLAAVHGAGTGHAWTGIACCLAFIGLQLAASPVRAADLRLLLVAPVCGLLIDGAFAASGLLRHASASDVLPAPPTQLLPEGSIVDTGDRSFEVFHLPGHSPGSIALYEKASQILFSGDVVYDGPLAYDAENADEMRQYVASMKRLLDLPVRVVHGGHYPSCGQERMRGIIRDFLAAFDR